MDKETQTFEVEIIEIDGAPPPPAKTVKLDSPFSRLAQEYWQQKKRRILKFDSRWWPLWVALGTLGIVLLLTVGLFVGIVFLLFRILVAIIKRFIR